MQARLPLRDRQNPLPWFNRQYDLSDSRINKMLSIEEEYRITINDALNHSFITDYNDKIVPRLTNDEIKNIY